MDATRFDALARSLAAPANRRATLRGLVGGALAAIGAGLGAEGGGAKKKKCRGGKKKCGGRCIPRTSCCRDADCGGGATCRDGTCVCPTGQRDCRGTCIPEGDCCTNADCGNCRACVGGQCFAGCQQGQECQDGECRCTANSCDGCCAGDTCHNGTTDSFCGSEGLVCDTCTGVTTCQYGRCRCASGQEECGGQCFDPCTGAPRVVRHPVTCACCIRPRDVCVGRSQLCCVGSCNGEVCAPANPTGTPCEFDAQCQVGFSCINGVCT